MATTESATPTDGDRKAAGAWYTPCELVELVVSRTVTPVWIDAIVDRRKGAPVRVLDPACGDGRFLAAAAERLGRAGVAVAGTGVDMNGAAVAATCAIGGGIEAIRADALTFDWGERRFDLVIGNPPFLSQLAARTTRGGSSRHGGGPYADAAAEFLSLATALTAPGGRVGLVLPQSILASRDAAGVRDAADRAMHHVWSWWSPRRHFDADVVVCAIGLERRDSPHECGPRDPTSTWGHVVAETMRIPRLPPLRLDGTIGDRADLNANFRDEYYGLVPAVGDGFDGPPLVTSGLIDPGRCEWGRRPVRFAKRSFDAPRVDLSRLDPRMRRWADRKLVPKVLVATQTPVIEAVADLDGSWLPGVPVTAVVPRRPTTVHEIAAVLTSPVASVTAWWRAAGTGLSATALRLGPAHLAALPWPTGDLGDAVEALRSGDVVGCGEAVAVAFGLDLDDPAVRWWRERVSPAPAGASSPGPGT